MTLHTQQSLSGFIASEPQQSVTENGDTRLYVRVGQPHFRREDDGGFTVLEPSFHDLVAYRATAERALTRFVKGDSFVAEGYVRTFQVERDGEAIEREEFVAKKIGHDLARTNYEASAPRARPSACAEVTTASWAMLSVAVRATTPRASKAAGSPPRRRYSWPHSLPDPPP